jgi:glucose-6-phosphate 1-dehydrogenase
LRPPRRGIFAGSQRTANYIRFGLSPKHFISLGVTVKHAGKQFAGEPEELFLLDEQPEARLPYDRLLSDAIAGDGTLFIGQAGVEAAWAVVDGVLDGRRRPWPYRPGSWGPKQAGTLLAPGIRWQSPTLRKH